MKTVFLFIVAGALLVSGCAGMRQSPGKSTVNTGRIQASAVQSSDPKTPTVQIVETETRLLPIHKVEPGPVIFGELVRREKVTTTIGAAQKNTAAEMAVKLASLKWVQWVGIALALFGVASLVYPPLKLIVGSVTTSLVCIASGAAMVFGPVLVVGNEVLILAVCGGVAGLYYFAHRHGELRGEVKTMKKGA